MNKIKVGTINLRNNAINRKGGLRTDGIDNAKIVAKHIIDEQFDILGTQELTRGFLKAIMLYLKNYKIYGNYRFGNNILSRYIKILDNFNESNSIITSHEVLQVKTKKLPFFTTKIKEIKYIFKKKLFFPRIYTLALVRKNNSIICIINTHLSYKMPSLQKKQLNYLYKEIKKSILKYHVILTGDFNMQIGDKIFDEFNYKLSSIGLKRVEVNDKTNSRKFKTKTAIDHIYVPNSWNIVHKGTNKIDDVTDHLEVFVEAEIK